MFARRMETCLRRLGVWMDLNGFAAASRTFRSALAWEAASDMFGLLWPGYCYAVHGEMWSRGLSVHMYRVYSSLHKQLLKQPRLPSHHFFDHEFFHLSNPLPSISYTIPFLQTLRNITTSSAIFRNPHANETKLIR